MSRHPWALAKLPAASRVILTHLCCLGTTTKSPKQAGTGLFPRGAQQGQLNLGFWSCSESTHPHITATSLHLGHLGVLRQESGVYLSHGSAVFLGYGANSGSFSGR